MNHDFISPLIVYDWLDSLDNQATDHAIEMLQRAKNEDWQYYSRVIFTLRTIVGAFE